MPGCTHKSQKDMNEALIEIEWSALQLPNQREP